jgi:hypothetical protein
MSTEPRTITFRSPRRTRLAVGVTATVAALASGGVWALSSASAAPGAPDAVAATTTAPGPTDSPWPPTDTPTPTPPASTSTSRTWTFEDGTPGGWYGFGYGAAMGPGAQTAPWVAPSAAAARAGRAGLLVGRLPAWGYQVGVDLDRSMLAPGRYAVTAQVRLAAGEPRTRIGVGSSTLSDGAPTTTDAGWTTITGSVDVPSDGRTSRLLIGPGRGLCEGRFEPVTAPATSFHLDQVSVVRTGAATSTATPSTTFACPVVTPAPTPLVKLHYEVTSVARGGFTATLTIHNLRDANSPITGWSLPLHLDGRRVQWVSGARLVTEDGLPMLTGTPGGPTAAIYGNSTYRISLGLTGSPIGSHDIVGSVRGVPTGWE